VLRAGVWTVPVVSVAVAAPAFACSTVDSLVLTSFAATYGVVKGDVDPTAIVVSSTVVNSGPEAIASLTRTLMIPAGLFDTVASTTPVGYSAPVIAGSVGTTRTLTYLRSGALPAGGTDSFSVTLTVGDTTAPLYRGWQGPAFTMGGEVNGGPACGVVTGAAPVAATPSTTLKINGWRSERLASTSLWVGDENAGGKAPTLVRNTGRKAAGPVTLTVTVPKVAGAYQSVSSAPPDNITDGWEFVSRTPAANADGPWHYTFRTTGGFLAPDAFANGAIRDTPRFRARIQLAGTPGGEPRTVAVTAVASAPGATDSPVATNDGN
jgi:hypothetical protein